MRLYSDLADWWTVLIPAEDSADQAEVVLGLIEAVLGAPPTSLLELGSAAGQLGSFVPEEVELVLVDQSEAMLAVSRPLNAGREHVQADLREVRLGREFDAVLLHDAVMYMCSEADLAKALATCFVHLRPGGIAIVMPDLVKEDFTERTLRGETHALDGRSAWVEELHRDPDPSDDTFQLTFRARLRDASGKEHRVLEEHTQGLFDRPTWARLVLAAGFELHWAELPPELGLGECFLLVRPTVA